MAALTPYLSPGLVRSPHSLMGVSPATAGDVNAAAASEATARPRSLALTMDSLLFSGWPPSEIGRVRRPWPCGRCDSIMTPPRWVDDDGQLCPTRPCSTCERIKYLAGGTLRDLQGER